MKSPQEEGPHLQASFPAPRSGRATLRFPSLLHGCCLCLTKLFAQSKRLLLIRRTELRVPALRAPRVYLLCRSNRIRSRGRRTPHSEFETHHRKDQRGPFLRRSPGERGPFPWMREGKSHLRQG